MNSKLLDTTGRAYGRKVPTYDPVLAEVGPGTPGGELLRRYWQPIALSREAGNLPKLIRRLGEDLILFRNKSGEPGLLYPRCSHRGTSLLYGRVEEDGIRCCYHGWKFSNQGVCLDQPCEPGGGRNKHRIRQPWYPVVEQHGAIFAYMGPPDRQPLFPIFSCFENLTDEEEVSADYFGENGEISKFPVDHNWFQTYENASDHLHVPILHALISGPQFDDPRMTSDMPEIKWCYSDAGDSILTITSRPMPNGQRWVRVEQGLIPNLLALPPFMGDGSSTSLSAFVPIDDTHFMPMNFERRRKDAPAMNPLEFAGFGPDNKAWSAMTLEEHQLYPNDYEAQASQGRISLHSEEHLSYSDTGVGMHRRLFKQQCEVVATGRSPVGVAFKEEDRRIVIEARSWVEDAAGSTRQQSSQD